MNAEAHWTILQEPLALWAANSNNENVPDIVKCNGILPVTDYRHITFFIAEVKGAEFVSNLYYGSPVTFLGSRIHDFVSYQYKGIFKSIRPCIEGDISRQLDYLEKFSDELQHLGFEKEASFAAYYHQPSVAITMEVQDVFEQTPRQGAGGSIKETNKL